jgi:hypothetical protein
MGSQKIVRLRRELYQEFSDSQIELLRALREEISSRRWKIMLEIDTVRGFVSGAESKIDDAGLRLTLEEVSRRLDEVHKDLSRIPEEIIPAF